MYPIFVVIIGVVIWVLSFIVVLSLLDVFPRDNAIYWPGKVIAAFVLYLIIESVLSFLIADVLKGIGKK